MGLSDHVRVVRQHLVVILAVATAAVAAAVGITTVREAQYEATTRLFFAVPSGDTVSELAQGSTFAERQMSSYAQVATSPLVLEPVIERLDLETDVATLSRAVSASSPLNTVILEITVTGGDSLQAARIANVVGASLTDVVANLYPARPDGTQAVRATTLTPAFASDTPVSPNMPLNIALGAVLGLALGYGTVLLRELLDTRIRTAEDVAAVTERPLLGSVAFDPATNDQAMVVAERPGSAHAEAIRRIRTNLQFVNATGHSRSLLVTSSVPGEGKTTTVVTLAAALADAGARVIVVDGDLRRPAVASSLGLEGAVGLTTALIGRANVNDIIQSWGPVDVLAAGPIPPNPSELLGSSAMTAVLADLTARYDVVLVDSAPLLPVTDAAILSKQIDGTLVVVGADRVHTAELKDAMGALEQVDAQILGIVLNKIARRDLTSYETNYGYAYAPESDRGGRRGAPLPAAGAPTTAATS